MKKWTKLICLFSTMAVLLSACGTANNPGPADTQAPDGTASTAPNGPSGTRTQTLFGTGTPGGVYEILGTGMVNILNQHLTDVEMVAVTPAQIQQLPSMIQSGEASIGIGMACMFERAFLGQEEFAGSPQMDLVQLCGMYDNIMGLVTLEGTGIKTIRDIDENTVVASTASNLFVLKELIKAAGTFDPEKINFRVMSYSQAAEALGDGNADVIYITAYPYNGTLDSVCSTKPTVFVEIDEDTRNNYNQANPRNLMQAVPANTYAGQAEDHWAHVVYTVLYANKNVPDNIIKETLATLIDNVDELAVVHPSGAGLTLETTQRYLDDGIMEIDRMHPAAVEYFAEQGVK